MTDDTITVTLRETTRRTELSTILPLMFTKLAAEAPDTANDPALYRCWTWGKKVIEAGSDLSESHIRQLPISEFTRVINEIVQYHADQHSVGTDEYRVDNDNGSFAGLDLNDDGSVDLEDMQ